MAFNRERFFRRADNGVIGSALAATADELAALHAEISRLDGVLTEELEKLRAQIAAALEAAMLAPEPEREKGWALVDSDGDPYTTDGYVFKQNSRYGGRKVVWFSEEVAKAFCDAVCAAGGSARAAILYKDTLEEVENA